MIEYLNSIESQLLDPYFRLTDVQLRNRLEPEKGIFIAESPKVIKRALEAHSEALSLLTTHSLIESDPIQELALDFGALHNAPVLCIPDSEFKRLTGFELAHGALAAFKRPKLKPLNELLKGASRIAILEDITNFTNVGAIFRSAAALGMDAVLITPGTCDPLYRRALRVSMGTVMQIPWGRIGVPHSDTPGSNGNVMRLGGWTNSGIPLLHDAGFKVASMALSDNDIDLDDPLLAAQEKLAIVLGTEGEGLSPITLAASDFVVKIPMHHEVDSLNVAAASAVAFWQLRR